MTNARAFADCPAAGARRIMSDLSPDWEMLAERFPVERRPIFD